MKADWGHCTVEYAVEVAAAAGVQRLALFHHDPSHDDETVARLEQEAQAMAVGTSLLEVFAAYEGLTVSLNLAPASA
jgi:ribonuclease BN (tRNA processing enzyme)